VAIEMLFRAWGPLRATKGPDFFGEFENVGRCERCGKNLGLVGRVHRCEPAVREIPAVTETPVTKNEAVTKIPIHPHMLRHGCGYALANAGHDTRALQAWLGHKNIQHTMRYTELAPHRFKDFWR
jgi:hypothetical protein